MHPWSHQASISNEHDIKRFGFKPTMKIGIGLCTCFWRSAVKDELIGLSKIGLWWYSYSTLLSFTSQALVFCNSKHSQQFQTRLVSVSAGSLYIYSSWAFIISHVQLGGVSMSSMIYSCPCVVLISCLITMWCCNSYMLSSEVGRSICKGFNASGLCLSILSSLCSSLNMGAAEGVGVVLSGRLMGSSMTRSVLTSNGLCIGRYGSRILDLGYISLCSIIGLACIKVGIVW